jgi:hypothetical protein
VREGVKRKNPFPLPVIVFLLVIPKRDCDLRFKRRKNAVDPRANDPYVLRRDSEYEPSTAWERAAAEWRGGRVLIHIRDFRNLTADKAVGFFVA